MTSISLSYYLSKNKIFSPTFIELALLNNPLTIIFVSGDTIKELNYSFSIEMDIKEIYIFSLRILTKFPLN